MAVLGRLLVSSAERLDLPDFLSIDSYTQGDFKYLMRSFVGSDRPYVFKGFEIIDPGNSIGTQNVAISIANSVVYYPESKAGPFFYGLEEGNPKAAPLVPELRKNATNYVYLVLTTFESAKDTRAFWDPDKEGGVGGEFTQDVNTESVLTVDVNVSVSTFPENVIPICKITVGTNFIESIEDARDMMFRLGSGGISPNPLTRYSFREEPLAAYKRLEPNTLMTSSLDPNSFRGGDKNIETLKEWMDVVMTKLLELSGTTYWYEDASSYSLVNIFKDSLATSIRSKGTWENSDITPGLLTWTEDIVIQSMTDKKDIIIRSGNKTLSNNQVMFVQHQRNVPINSGSTAVDWLSGLPYVNGELGAFENLAKGDWIKKASDPDYRYLRVEEFYTAISLGGVPTTPGNATSIRLSETYSGITEISQGIFNKGEFTLSDVQVVNRDDSALYAAGGDLCWLASRTDRVLNVSDITTIELTINITAHDGERARCTSVGHGLSDKQRIYIASTPLNPSNFSGEYQVEVEDSQIFFINKTGAILADEVSKKVYYAVVTTSSNSTDTGFLLESENHGFDVDHAVKITNSDNYDGSYAVFPKTSTQFTMPVTGSIAAESFPTASSTPPWNSSVIYASGTFVSYLSKVYKSKTSANVSNAPSSSPANWIVYPSQATSIEMYVRADLGPTKIEQGESKQIGKVDSQNIMSFIGMENSAMMKPVYATEPDYNTINGFSNYNSSSSDSLTQRASKLTAMMADKAQDKTITYELSGTYAIVSSNNAIPGYMDIAAFAKLGHTPKLTFVQPSTEYKLEVTLSGTLTLGTDEAAYVSLNRNDNTIVANLGSLTVCSLKELPLNENTFVFALRGSTDAIMLWDKTPVRNYSTAIEEAVTEITQINLPSASTVTSGQYFKMNSTLDLNKYYVWFKKDAVGTDPMVIGRVGIEVNIVTGDGPTNMAIATSSAISAIATGLSCVDNLDGTITITNSSAGFCDDAINVDVGGLSIVILQAGSGAALHYLSDGDLLETAIKKLDQKLFEIATAIPEEAYEEIINIISGTATNDNELQDINATSGSSVVLPKDSRNSEIVRAYVVGQGQLEIFLNGQYLILGQDWAEVGTAGTESITIQLLQDLHVTDALLFRIDNYSIGGGAGSAGSGEANTASNIGGGNGIFSSKVGIDLRFKTIVTGAGISIINTPSTLTISSTPVAAALSVTTITGANYTALPANDVILVYNAGNNVNITLPSAALNTGKRFDIKKVDTGNVIRIKGSAGQTLDGVDIFSSSWDILIQYECVTVVSNGVNWFII
jgi:hypothetical protein